MLKHENRRSYSWGPQDWLGNNPKQKTGEGKVLEWKETELILTEGRLEVSGGKFKLGKIGKLTEDAMRSNMHGYMIGKVKRKKARRRRKKQILEK